MGRGTVKLIILSMLYLLPVFFVSAADVETVIYSQENTLRTLAKKYLNEPNDWEIILFYNGYKTLNEIQIGTEIQIPVKLYKSTVDRLEKTQKLVSEANNKGARILANDIFEQAIDYQGQAIQLKSDGKLTLAKEAAQKALGFTQKAISEIAAKRIQSITAILSQKKGDVESKNNNEVIWTDVTLKQELIEKERVRTLSKSNGEITFVDGSKLNLGENSLAVIESMKKDLIQNSSSSSVTVMEGDIFAHLSGLSKKNDINVSTPGVETEIRSRRFRTSRDENKISRIANYDGEIDVSAGGGVVTIGKNEGTQIVAGKIPDKASKLLSPPRITEPENKERIYSNNIKFSWTTDPNASTYLIEISAFRSFSNMEIREKVLSNHIYRDIKKLGIFFFRVACVDENGLVGNYSDPVEFYLDKDVIPPYLTLNEPEDGQVFFSNKISVTGISENDASVSVNGREVEVDFDGNFAVELEVQPGRQEIMAVAMDNAGNVTNVDVLITFTDEKKLVVLDKAGVLRTNKDNFMISGRIKPLTTIDINGQTISVSGNEFQHLVQLLPGSNHFKIEASSTKGDVESHTLDVVLDTEDPEIVLDDFPLKTKMNSVKISGNITEKAEIRFNDAKIATGTDFLQDVDLKEGNNVYILTALDVAGNMSSTTVEILKDTQKPKITSCKFSKENVQGGDFVTIEVYASDVGVGLSRNANFIVKLLPGDNKLHGMLTLASTRDKYIGNLMIPPGAQGKLELKSVKISDYLNNVSVYP